MAVGDRVGDYVIDFVWDSEAGDSYDATHVMLPRRVRLSIAPRPAGAVRMMREACILEALQHPGVPRVFEVGIIDVPGQVARPWVATEIIYGQSLLEISLGEGRLAVRDVLGMLRDIADTLACAHQRGVAHCNVRSDEIVRVDHGRDISACLVNWQSARVFEAEDEKQRAFADDVFALGLVADLALASRSSAPVKLAVLLNEMLAAVPESRPRAAEVAARATQILESLDAEGEMVDGDVILEEDLVLEDDAVDVSFDDVPEAMARGTGQQSVVFASAEVTMSPPRVRAGWTPAIRMDTTPSRGIPLAAIKPRHS